MKYSPTIACAYLHQNGIPIPQTEHQFCASRKWRFDFAWPLQRLALEVEGGVWTGGRHTRGSGFVKDLAKYNTAASMGWRVVRCEPRHLMTQATLQLLHTCLLHNRNDAEAVQTKLLCPWCGRGDVE